MWPRILVLLCLFITETLSQNLVIRPEGQLQSQPAGKGFVLTCQGEANEPDLFTQMKWRGPNNEEISEGSRGPVEVSRSGSSLVLVFKNPGTEATGTYNCSAQYDNTRSLHASVQLVFYQDITWEDCDSNQALIINQPGKVQCRVSANPSATYTWSKDGHSLEPGHYAVDAGGVAVDNVQLQDAGTYTIRAMVTLTGRFQARTIHVDVHLPPSIVKLQDAEELIEGETAVLLCEATGSPPPNYSWFDSKNFKLNGEEGFIVDETSGSLTINSVATQLKGTLTCMAFNDAGEAKKSMDISIIVKPKIIHFENQTVEENKETTLECQAGGNPHPHLTIRKEGMTNAYSDQDDGVSLHSSKVNGNIKLQLTIKQALRVHDGLYFCSAENKGAKVERTGHLSVEFAPVLSSTPSTLIKSWRGNPVNITCVANAVPNATLSWQFLGRDIRNDDPAYVVFGTQSHSNLLVKPGRDGSSVYGTYKCKAENKLGSNAINIELQEAHTPGPIIEAHIEKKTATTITFSFQGPVVDGGLPVRAFVAQYRGEGEPIHFEKQLEWSEGTPYIIEHLLPRTPYIFRFAAKNDVGIGEFTSERPITTPTESAPEAPKFITPGGNVSRYHNKFEVRWTVPLDNGREIDYFQLRYFSVEKQGGQYIQKGKDVFHNIMDWKNAPRFELTELRQDSFYRVEVRAHNTIGFSQEAFMVFRTAEGSVPDGQKVQTTDGEDPPVSMGTIIAIIVLLVILVLIVMDIVCFVRYQWGLVFLIRAMLCGKSSDKVKEVSVEDGKGFGSSDKDKLNDNGLDLEIKNKSPKGSKSNIAKDSLV